MSDHIELPGRTLPKSDFLLRLKRKEKQLKKFLVYFEKELARIQQRIKSIEE